jgi:ABC-type transport system involved in multi-copper enzyme maturation permease subunit
MGLGAFGAFFAGSAVYGGNLPSYSIGDAGVLRAVLSVGFYGACVALIGIAVGFLVRSTATAIGVLLGLLMLAPLLVELVPGTVGETLTKIVPSNAGEAMMSVTARDSLLSPLPALAVLVAWVVGLLAIAAVTVRRRDA